MKFPCRARLKSSNYPLQFHQKCKFHPKFFETCMKKLLKGLLMPQTFEFSAIWFVCPKLFSVSPRVFKQARGPYYFWYPFKSDQNLLSQDHAVRKLLDAFPLCNSMFECSEYVINPSYFWAHLKLKEPSVQSAKPFSREISNPSVPFKFYQNVNSHPKKRWNTCVKNGLLKGLLMPQMFEFSTMIRGQKQFSNCSVRCPCKSRIFSNLP